MNHTPYALAAASIDSCDQPEVGTAFRSSRNMLPAVDHSCHPMRRRLAPVGAATCSAIQSNPLNLPFLSNPPTSVRFGPPPTSLSGGAPALAARPRREQVGTAFLHRLEELIAVGNNCAQEGRETERALSNPEFIGLDVPRGGRDLHCRPTSASFACRTRATAIRSRRSRCGDSFFAKASGTDPRSGRTRPGTGVNRTRPTLLRRIPPVGPDTGQSFKIMPEGS